MGKKKLKILIVWIVALLLLMAYQFIGLNIGADRSLPFREKNGLEASIDRSQQNAYRDRERQAGDGPCATGKRVTHVKEWCSNRDTPTELPAITWRNLYVDHANKLLYCEVPKAGASSIKRLLIQSSQFYTQGAELPKNVHKGLANFNITHPDQDLDKLRPILDSYFKFIVIRHPFSRLLSAYKDKFFDGKIFLPKVAKHIISRYRQIGHNGIQNDSMFPSWQEFAEFVGTEHPNSTERHWRPITELCSLCLIQFDAILKLEDFEEDISVLKHVGLNFSAIPHENQSKGIKGKSVASYYRELREEVVRKLEHVYRDDFEAFGYDNTLELLKTVQ